MSKSMRVYEFAKQKGLSSKEIVALLDKANFPSYTHISVLREDALAYLNNHFNKNQQKAVDSSKKLSQDKSEQMQKKQAENASTQKIATKPSNPLPLKKKKLDRRSLTNEVSQSKEAVVTDDMPLFEVADLLGKSVGELIVALMGRGMVCNRNYILSIEIIKELAEEYKVPVKFPSKDNDVLNFIKKDTGGIERWPVVVVMGHVDHGKTTLLDFIRKTRVASREKGGITQHLGAYEADTDHGKIVFLDTPGHAAFSHMRERGTKITDIVVLVVAADDGVMPQTVEVIKAAKAANVPVIVAINKIDKATSPTAIEDVKRQLAQHDLIPEDWGGETVIVPISAKTGKGVDELLEMVVLQAQLMGLTADPSRPGKAYVLEANMEVGHGPVATIICFDGTVKRGDCFICASSSGKARLLINSYGKRVNQAGPSMPVKVVGFDTLPKAGDWFEVVSGDVYQKEKGSKSEKAIIPTSLFSGSALGETESINIVLKSDTFGTSEAVLDSIAKLSALHKDSEASLKVVHSGVGDITEGDITLAVDTNAIILGMNVKVEKNAALAAKNLKMDILLYQVIYKLIDFLEDVLEKRKKEEIVDRKIGEGVILKIFDIKGKGVIAGGRVRDGIFSKEGKVSCVRGGKVIGSGKITSLQKDKRSVKEVHKGSEFAFFCNDFQEWQVDDIVECSLEEVKK